MTDHQKLLDIDNLVSEMEMSQERAYAIASNIDQGYFDLKDDFSREFYFAHYDIEFDILFDYLIKAEEQLKQIKDILKTN